MGQHCHRLKCIAWIWTQRHKHKNFSPQIFWITTE